MSRSYILSMLLAVGSAGSVAYLSAQDVPADPFAADDPVDPADPFGVDTPADPAGTAPAAADDPFAAEPTPAADPLALPAAAGAADDPFGAESVATPAPSVVRPGEEGVVRAVEENPVHEDPLGDAPAPAAAPSLGDDPFGLDPAPADAPAVLSTPTPAADPLADPFGTEPTAPAAVPPPGDDPFAVDPAAPAVTPAPATAPVADAVDDPFGLESAAPAPAADPAMVDDPFGSDPLPATPAPAAVAPAPAAIPLDDPFAAEPEAPAATPAPAPAVAPNPFLDEPASEAGLFGVPEPAAVPAPVEPAPLVPAVPLIPAAPAAEVPPAARSLTPAEPAIPVLPDEPLVSAESLPPGVANTGVLAELYGEGVHAYHSHRFQRAWELLSEAIAAGSTDPRTYYFRGLAAGAQGRLDEADVDFETGARFEAHGTFGPEIGRALTRTQGTCRIHIEELRRKARQEYEAERASDADYRSSVLGAQEQEILREPPRPRQPPVIPGTESVGGVSPFDDPAALGQPQVQAADALQGVEAVDPLGGQPAAPAAPATPAAPAADDPFGTDSAAPMDDPFATPAGGTDPFGSN